MMVVMALKDDIQAAHDVATAATVLRQDLRWNVKPGDPAREKQISEMLERVRVAMIPIRSAMGRTFWGQLTAKETEKVRAASAELQYQRKQLKKMRRS
jgi:hypothetical protein